MPFESRETPGEMVHAVNLPDGTIADQLREIDTRHRRWSAHSGNAQRIGQAWQAARDRAWLLQLLDEVYVGDARAEQAPPPPKPAMTHEERVRVLRAMHELTRVVLHEGTPYVPEGIRECQERGLLECDRTKYPPYPDLTSEGISMLAQLVDLFEVKS
jgi:hypothetical protein